MRSAAGPSLRWHPPGSAHHRHRRKKADAFNAHRVGVDTAGEALAQQVEVALLGPLPEIVHLPLLGSHLVMGGRRGGVRCAPMGRRTPAALCALYALNAERTDTANIISSRNR